MTFEEYLSNMKPGYTVDGGSEDHLIMHELSQRALKITMELNNKYHTKEEIVQLMSELTGQKIDESFGMFPPFYTDCGRNIHIGNNVFINAGCKFQDQGEQTVSAFLSIPALMQPVYFSNLTAYQIHAPARR